MITIRPAVPDDAAALRALALASPEMGNVQARPEFHADAYTATLAPSPGSQGLVACTPRGRVVGQIFWRPVEVLIDGQPMLATHVFFLAVHPDFRRQGIGHRLSLAARDAGRDAGGQLFYGHVQQGNLASINTFRKLGCLPVGRLTRAVVPLHRRPPGQRFGFWMIRSAIRGPKSESETPGGVQIRAGRPEDLPAFARSGNEFYVEHNFWSPLTVHGLQAWLNPDDNRIRRSLYVAEDAGGQLLAGVAVSDATALRTGVVAHAPWLVRVIGRCLGLIDATGHMRFVRAEVPWYHPGQAAAARYLWDWLRWHLRQPCGIGDPDAACGVDRHIPQGQPCGIRRPKKATDGSSILQGQQATALLIDYDSQGPAARAVTRPRYAPVVHYHVYAGPGSPTGSAEGESEVIDCPVALDPTRLVASGLAVSLSGSPVKTGC